MGTPIDNGLFMEEMSKARAQNINDKKHIRLGYERVKQKVKDISQEYRKAVTEGRRSGSGKLVADSWKNVWRERGSPAANFIENSVCISTNGDNIEEEADQGETVDDHEQSREGGQTSLSTESGQRAGPSKTVQYVDNKPKQMEKHLSANRRDKLYLDIARDELAGKYNERPRGSPKLVK